MFDPMRREAWAPLSDIQKVRVSLIKNKCHELWEFLDGLGESRELSIAKTKLEEACMWSVKHVTSPEKT